MDNHNAGEGYDEVLKQEEQYRACKSKISPTDPCRVEWMHRFPFAQVAAAHFSMYPCAEDSRVEAVELMDQCTKGRVVYKTRKFRLRNVAPSMFDKILGNSSHLYFEEWSIYDPEAKKLSTYSRNISCRSLGNVTETSTYTQDEENPQWTKFEGYAMMECTGCPRFIKPLGDATLRYFFCGNWAKGHKTLDRQMENGSGKEKLSTQPR